MAIVGFNFTKINVERKKAVTGKVNITNNVAVKDIVEVDLALGKAKQKALKFVFEYVSKYEPDVGDITLTGDVIYLQEEKIVSDIAKQWKKDKSMPKDVMTVILNNILNKCNIEALILSRDMNLPAPIVLPKVKVAEERK